jgi:hypothetical protein
MNPVFTISALPATSSGAGSVSSTARSTSTADGSWNAPTRFLPAAVLMPVFPPTAASTIASSVVGTCTTRTPRIHVAATNPARSVTAPPPSETTTSPRVSPTRPQTSQQKPATVRALPSSASGTSTRCASTPTPSRSALACSATSASAGWWTISAAPAPRPVTVAVSSLRTPRPTSTG